MSVLATKIVNSDVSLVLPNVDRLTFVSINKKDKALCYVINKGYIESSQLDVCRGIAFFITKTYKDFRLLGDLDKVVRKDGSICYRQRVYFSSISKLIPILSYYDIDLVIDKRFKVGVDQVSNCPMVLPKLKKYLSTGNQKGYTLENWLTSSCIIQLKLLCLMDNVTFISNNKYSLLKTNMLFRAPYIRGSIDNKTGISTVLILPDTSLNVSAKNKHISLLTDDTNIKSVRSKVVTLKGYTLCNARKDTKRGGIIWKKA